MKKSISRKTLKEIVKLEINRIVLENEEDRQAGASAAGQAPAKKEKKAELDIKTIGDLKKAVKAAVLKKRGKLVKGGIADAAAGMFIDAVPFGGLVKDLGAAAVAAYKLPDSAQTQTGLDHLNVDDKVSAIVADEVENAFLKSLSKKLEGLSDETPLAKVDMTQMLSSFIASKFNNRTVAGFEGK